MADFNAQNTDSENSKGPLKSTVRDNDLRKITTRVEPSPTVK
jgi:hypothetical protein